MKKQSEIEKLIDKNFYLDRKLFIDDLYSAIIKKMPKKQMCRNCGTTDDDDHAISCNPYQRGEIRHHNKCRQLCLTAINKLFGKE